MNADMDTEIEMVENRADGVVESPGFPPKADSPVQRSAPSPTINTKEAMAEVMAMFGGCTLKEFCAKTNHELCASHFRCQ